MATKKQIKTEGVAISDVMAVTIKHGHSWVLGVKPLGENEQVNVSLTSSEDVYVNVMRFADPFGAELIDTLSEKVMAGDAFTCEQKAVVGAQYVNVQVTNVSGRTALIGGLGVFTS